MKCPRMSGKTIVVWFSCGAASAIALQETLRQYGDHNTVRAVNSPILEEDADNRRFAADVGAWLGIDIELALHPKYPDASAARVWGAERYMSGIKGAPCTKILKKQARYYWEAHNTPDWHVLGFTAEETSRFSRFIMTERSNVIPVLISAGLTKQDCFDRLVQAGIAPPRVYLDGYPNANCIGCVKATSPTYWNHVREKHPAVFAARAVQSRELGARLARHKGERVFLDELPEDAVGRPLASMQIDCGVFCDEDVPPYIA